MKMGTRETFKLVSYSVTKLGNFLKFFVTNFLTKLVQIFKNFWAILNDVTF